MRWQGYGKRKSAVGMPRPKKTKVEAVNCLGPSTMDMSTGTTDVEEVSASTVAELAAGVAF